MKENNTFVNARWNGVWLISVKWDGACCFRFTFVDRCSLQFVRHLLCYNQHLLPSCFFQLSLLPCLQQILILKGMVRKEQRLYIDVSIDT